MSPEEAVRFLRKCSVPNLIFDLDDTLYSRGEPYRRAFRELYGDRAGRDGFPDEEMLYRVSRPIGEEEYMRRIRGEIDLREMQRLRTQRSFLACGVELSDEEALAFEDRYTEAQRHITLHPAFRAFFEEECLAPQRHFLGIMTNGPAERQWNKIRSLGLLQWIPGENIYISGEKGIGKPSEEAFRRYEKMTGVRPGETMLIGDSEETDIAGAELAGWKSLHIS